MKTIIKPSSLIGQQLQNRYRVIRVLGSGAFGQTYLAQDCSQEDLPCCLVKHYSNAQKSAHLFASYRRLFVTETSNLLKLDGHSQIPRLLDCFEQEDGLYIIEEFIKGKLLSQILPIKIKSENCWTQEQVLNLLQDLLTVLAFVHNNGIIHCDLKPNNIIKRESDHRFVLIDFATSQPIPNHENQEDINEKFSFKKTFAVSPSGYIPPEQMMGHPLANSDIYALGIIVIQALTGIEPIDLQLDLKTEQLHWQYGLEGKQYVDERLINILNKMVAYQSSQRYQSVTEVMQDLEPLSNYESLPIKVFLEDTWPGMSEIQSYSQDQPIPIKLKGNEENVDLTFVELAQGLLTEYVGPTSPIRQSVDVEIEFESDDFLLEEKEVSRFNFQKYIPLVAGVGITACLITFGFLSLGLEGWSELLTNANGRRLLKATEAYQNGNFAEAIALAESISEDSKVYQEAQILAKQWQKEWHQANETYQEIQEAFKQKNWSKVIKQSQNIPQITYWNNKVNPLVKQAQNQIESQAYNLIKQAFVKAEAKDFTAALTYLEKIPTESKIYPKVQVKLTEYRQKQVVRSHYYLQQAFNHAQKRDFLGAIEFLKKIPPESDVAKIAQNKIIQYSEYQQIKEQVERKKALSAVILEQHQKLQNFVTSESKAIATMFLNPGFILREIKP